MSEDLVVPVVVPPWDWRELPEQEWCDMLAELRRWVGWLESAYPAIRLPECWERHEGIRLELIGHWMSWQELMAPRALAEEQPATAVVDWHSRLWQAQVNWGVHTGSHNGWQEGRETVLAQRGAGPDEEAVVRQAWRLEERSRRRALAGGVREPWTPGRA